MSEPGLEVVFRFIAAPDEPSATVVDVVAPIGSKLRYLNGVELRSRQYNGNLSTIFRLPLLLHTRDITALHTVCRRSGRVGLRCPACRYEVHSVEPFDALRDLADHAGREHPTVPPAFLITELVDVSPRRIDQVEW